MSFIRKHGVVLGGALFVLAAGWLFVQPEPKLQNKLDLSVIPMEYAGYYGRDIDITDVPIEEQLAPQAILFRDYEKGGDRPITLCLVYNYARRSRSFHDPHVCYPAQGFKLRQLPSRVINVGGMDVTAHVMIAEKNHQESMIVYWYMSGDKPLEERGGREGFLKAAVMSRLRRDLGVSNMVRVSTPILYGEETAFQQLHSFLKAYFPHIRKVRADVAQEPMPARRLWTSGPAGKAAVVLMLILPLALVAVSLAKPKESGSG